MFSRIEINRWRQFESVRIDFHPALTVLTGANGAGKTTILNLINRHFGWNLEVVSTPRRTRRGLARFFSGIWPDRKAKADDQVREVGRVSYSEGEPAVLLVPDEVEPSYQVNIQNLTPIPGIFVPSHRPVYGVYQKVDQIPTELDAKEQLFDRYVNELRNLFQPRGRSLASFQVKQALISLATFGYGNQAVRQNPEAIETFEGFQKVLKAVLPPSLGFERFEVRLPDVVLETKSGEFSLDAVSGGVAALIDVAWQIFLRSRISDAFAVVIDEPENHLHPELQRTMLPSLIEAFPQAQFIVATHNPFIVTAVRDSNVYVLKYNEEQTVVSELLDWANKAGSSNEILRDVLGLPNALPLWVENQLEELAKRHAQLELSEQSLTQLKEDLSAVGMADLLPDTLARILDEKID